MARREHWAVLGLLLSIVEDTSTGDPLPPSRMAQRANLPYDRFTTYLGELRERGLVTPGEDLQLTDKGQSLLKSWKQWQAVLQRFGLD